MQKVLVKAVKGLLWGLFVLSGVLMFYYVAGKVLGSIEVEPKRSAVLGEKTVTCYLKSNGVHTDIVLPIKSDTFDWGAFINQDFNKKTLEKPRFLAFGWGDKGFYLNTPTWGDLTVSTAVKAGFGLSSSAMHVTYYSGINETENCVKIKLSEYQYGKLVKNIQKKFGTRQAQLLPISTDQNYGAHDAFYEARGKYSIFNTCNVWVSSVLKESGIKAGWWTPFSQEVLSHYN